jgi:hypothetical protein
MLASCFVQRALFICHRVVSVGVHGELVLWLDVLSCLPKPQPEPWTDAPVAAKTWS